MTTREYSVGAQGRFFRITIKKKRNATANVSYDFLCGYDTEEAANLDVLRYQEHVAANKFHSSFIRQTSLPKQTPRKKLKIANESMRRVRQRLDEKAVFGTAYKFKILGLSNKYASYVAECAGNGATPLQFEVWEDLFTRKTPEQRARYFRCTCRNAVMRDQTSLEDIASVDTDIQVKGLLNSMHYMHQSLERVTQQNVVLATYFNKLSLSMRL